MKRRKRALSPPSGLTKLGHRWLRSRVLGALIAKRAAWEPDILATVQSAAIAEGHGIGAGGVPRVAAITPHAILAALLALDFAGKARRGPGGAWAPTERHGVAQG